MKAGRNPSVPRRRRRRLGWRRRVGWPAVVVGVLLALYGYLGVQKVAAGGGWTLMAAAVLCSAR